MFKNILLIWALVGFFLSGCDINFWDESSSGCEEGYSVTGAVSNDVSPIDYTNGNVAVSLLHKLDIDEAEDRCLASIDVSLSVLQGGCELRMKFSTNPDNAFLELENATLRADSLCAGWSDSDEGTYTYQGGERPVFVGPQRVPDAVAATSCFTSELRFDGAIVLVREDGAELEANLSGLSIEGEFVSQGDPSLVCPKNSGIGNDEGSETPADLPSGDGDIQETWEQSFLFALRMVLAQALPLQFAADMTFVQFNDNSRQLDMTLQPLSLDVGETDSPRQPVGSAIQIKGVEVGPDFDFEVYIGEVSLPPSANPISGSAMVIEDLSLRGWIIDGDIICGWVKGSLSAPIVAPLDYGNSSFGAEPIPDGEPLPTFEDMVLGCPDDYF